MKIVMDSSSNLRELEDANFAAAPLKVLIGNKEFVDVRGTDVAAMVNELETSKEKTSTACPSIQDWLDAFADEMEIIVVTITSKLSGCFNSAAIAAKEYLSEHPERKVYVMDSLSTGPEMEVIAEKCAELINEGKNYEQVCQEITEYRHKTGLLFVLGSLRNLAKNGRVNTAIAKLVDTLHIFIVGKASIVGDLDPSNKCRGKKRAMEQIYENMIKEGYKGGKVRIRHTESPGDALALQTHILKYWPNVDIKIGKNKALCAYYAEKGGVLVGFEKG